jgi:hypothetical protein
MHAAWTSLGVGVSSAAAVYAGCGCMAAALCNLLKHNFTAYTSSFSSMHEQPQMGLL